MMMGKMRSLSDKKRNNILKGLYVLFFMYSCLMIWEVFIGPYRSFSGVRRYNLCPFRTIGEFIVNASRYGYEATFINLAANIITFVPLGFFMALIFRKSCSLAKAALWCVFIIICIEAGQFILNVGVMDIDDVILNTTGCTLGFGVYKLVEKIW